MEFSVFTGYLKQISRKMENETQYLTMAVPNLEVKYIFNNTITKWFRDQIKVKDLSQMYAAMLEGEADQFQAELSGLLQESISYMDTQEAFYHGFMMGVLNNLRDYLVKSNRESGNGRLDILVRSHNVSKTPVIMELKVSETYKGMENACDTAMQQIEEKSMIPACLRRDTPMFCSMALHSSGSSAELRYIANDFKKYQFRRRENYDCVKTYGTAVSFCRGTCSSCFLTDNSPKLRSNLKRTSGFLLDAQWKKDILSLTLMERKYIMNRTVFGAAEGEQKVSLFTLKNRNGMEITMSDLGAVLTRVIVPDQEGHPRDVVLGYESPEEYRKNTNTYFGSTIGRNGNRLEGAAVTLEGKVYHMTPNEGENNLHSGPDGYQIRMWDVKETAEDRNEVTFVLESPDGDQGFPGNLKLEVTYALTDENEIRITYKGVSDAETVFNPTNHSYFNLGGHDSGTILNHVLTLMADSYTPVRDSASIPTGEKADVTGTPMDFRQGKAIGLDIDADFQQLQYTGGYDHNFVINQNAVSDDTTTGLYRAAVAVCSESGITMEVDTDRPGVQLYAGNFLKEEPGKGGVKYGKRCGFCLETQYFPNAANEPAFASPIIKANEPCVTETVYRFKSQGLEQGGEGR